MELHLVASGCIWWQRIWSMGPSGTAADGTMGRTGRGPTHAGRSGAGRTGTTEISVNDRPIDSSGGWTGDRPADRAVEHAVRSAQDTRETSRRLAMVHEAVLAGELP